MVLTNTIILPAGNPDLSKKELATLLAKKDILSAIIFGMNPAADNAVKVADIRANETVSGIDRRVAWMQDPGMLSFLKTLISDGPEYSVDSIDMDNHIGIAISPDHQLKDMIPNDTELDFIRMELAFINAGK